MSDVEQEAVELFRQGLSYDEIALAQRVTRGVVSGRISRYRQRAREMAKGQKHTEGFWTGEQMGLLRSMHDDNKTITEISMAVSKSYESVRQQGRRMGLTWDHLRYIPRVNRVVEDRGTTEKQLLERHIENDKAFYRKVLMAMWNGDNVPAGQPKPVRPLILQG